VRPAAAAGGLIAPEPQGSQIAKIIYCREKKKEEEN
jgi:hypothetical protein